MKLARRILAIALLFVAVLYACDYLSVRYHIPHNRNPLGVVKVQPYYAVPLKNKKTELMFLDPQEETCIHSLFPHLGYRPCWYVSRQSKKRIDM